jgi:transcriptional regulator with XRE-family HTH domain
MEGVDLPVGELRAAVRDLGLTQMQISLESGISQGQISRLLSGANSGSSKMYRRLCKYVIKKRGGISEERVRANEELMQALAATWDGTREHAAALSKVILSLRQLRYEH